MLRRAIASVEAQTFRDWELVISDDEDPPGETWSFLKSIESPRVRVLRNPGPHGQAGNVNVALQAARGTWIKPLYDDDLLRPDCLEVFMRAVAGLDHVAMASCRADHYVEGRWIRADRFSPYPEVELIEQRYAHLGMYLQDDVGGGMPTQVMVHRRCIAEGALFEPHPGIVSGVDTLWFMRVLEHGDSLIINRTLVEEHQGSHHTVTRGVSDLALDREYMRMRELQFQAINPALRPPSLTVTRQALLLMRAVHRLKRKRGLEALSLASRAWHPQAWHLAIRWLLRQKWPGRFHEVPRIRLT